MSFYPRHVFFCCSQRQEGEQCRNNGGSQKLRGKRIRLGMLNYYLA